MLCRAKQQSVFGKTQKPKPESKNFLLSLFGKNCGIYLITGHLPDGYLPGTYWVFTLSGYLADGIYPVFI